MEYDQNYFWPRMSRKGVLLSLGSENQPLSNFCSVGLLIQIRWHIWKLLKGQCHEIFCFWIFSSISFPPAPEYPIKTVSNFFENSRRYSQLKVDHWCRWHQWQICHKYQPHRWQTMGLISGCRYLKVNLKAKMYICVTSTIQRCPNKIIKIFLIADFFHLPPLSLTPVANLDLRISPQIFEKIRNGPNGILWGWGETDWWKKPEAKISWHCPFNRVGADNCLQHAGQPIAFLWVKISNNPID
jgi:hypothetical protein